MSRELQIDAANMYPPPSLPPLPPSSPLSVKVFDAVFRGIEYVVNPFCPQCLDCGWFICRCVLHACQRLPEVQEARELWLRGMTLELLQKEFAEMALEGTRATWRAFCIQEGNELKRAFAAYSQFQDSEEQVMWDQESLTFCLASTFPHECTEQLKA